MYCLDVNINIIEKLVKIVNVMDRDKAMSNVYSPFVTPFAYVFSKALQDFWTIIDS